MSRVVVTRMVSLIMAVLLPSTTLLAQAPPPAAATTPTAMLASQGDTSINGKKVPSSIAVFVGDRIQTGESSVATLTAKNASVLMFSHTMLTYGGNYVEMGCGAVALDITGNALTARVQNLVVTPNSETAKIEITKINGKLQIGARQGSATVDDGTQKVQVETGKMLSFDNTGDCNRKAAGAPPGTTGAPSPVYVSNALKYALIGGVGAGVLLLILQAGGGKSTPPPPVSPSDP
ncbi:MAG TPA: hypothetical protein VE994_16835 [Terriglobales bacterium]|nr:hypothetical protein [Terriglobales bacterium]